jgi:hypothetical protein
MFTNQQGQNPPVYFYHPDQLSVTFPHGGTYSDYSDSYLPFLISNHGVLASQVQELKASISGLQKELMEVSQKVRLEEAASA